MKSDSQSKVNPSEDGELEVEAITQYLLDHPDFFIGRDELLANLSIPHESGNAISLLERQVILLRDRNEELDEQIKEFIDNANENDALFEKTRLIILKLLKANTLVEISSILEKEITENFEASESRLLFISDDKNLEGLSCRSYTEARETLGKLFEKKRTFFGEIKSKQAQFLFPETTSAIVSVAVVPIHFSSPDDSPPVISAMPVLVIGSDSARHFNSSQDTLFLDFIGEVLAGLITRLG